MSKKLTKAEIAAGFTVKMPKELLDKFLATLRSGKVKQGESSLFDGQGYCCLGVLQAVQSGGKCEVSEYTGKFLGLPSEEWCKKSGISWTGGSDGFDPVISAGKHGEITASEANDGLAWSFKKIADAFEKVTATY